MCLNLKQPHKGVIPILATCSAIPLLLLFLSLPLLFSLSGCNSPAIQPQQSPPQPQPPNFAALARQISGPVGDQGSGQGFAVLPEDSPYWLFNSKTANPPTDMEVTQFRLLEVPIQPNGRLDWYYDPTNLPSEIDGARLMEIMQRTARKWMDVCNVQIIYKGNAGASPNSDPMRNDFLLRPQERDGRNLISWASAARNLSPINGGLDKNMFFYSLSATGKAANGQNTMQEIDIYLNSDVWAMLSQKWGYDDAYPYYVLEGEIGQIFGTLLGLNQGPRSRQNNSIFKLRNGDSFNRTIQGANIEDCVDLYGRTEKTNISRIFNWLEIQLESGYDIGGLGLAGPRGQLTEEAYGGYYRYLPKGNPGKTFIGEYQGMIYVLFPNQPLQALGTTQQLLPEAIWYGY